MAPRLRTHRAYRQPVCRRVTSATGRRRLFFYQLGECHYTDFLRELTHRGRSMPAYVEEEFEAYLKCGRLEHGFLRVRCTTCHAERLVDFSGKRRGFCPSCGARRMTESAALLVDAVLSREPILRTGQTGAVTLIQRFGSALNLNIHFHMLCLDGQGLDPLLRPQQGTRFGGFFASGAAGSPSIFLRFVAQSATYGKTQ